MLRVFSCVLLFITTALCVSSVDETIYDTIATLRSNKTGGNVEMVVGFNSSHPLLRLYSVENGLSALAGFTSPDPKRPPDLAFDGSLFSYGATTTDCHPCVMAVQLPEVTHISRLTLWSYRNIDDRENFKSLTDIQVELAVRDESNILTYDIGKDGRSMFLSKIYNPSSVTWSNNTDLSLVYRSIEIDVAAETGSDGVLANYIRVQRSTAPGQSRLLIAELDIHAATPTNCKYSQWGPWTACSPPCSNLAGEQAVQTRTRTILNEASWGGTACVPTSTVEISRANCTGSFYPACTKDCTWSEWVVWSPCSVTCGTGTKSRYRAKLGPTDGGKDCEGTTTMEKVQCTGALAKCPQGDNPCAALRSFGRQKCIDKLWTVNNAEEFIAPLFYSFDGSIKVTNSFVVVSDIRVAGDLILSEGATLHVLQGGNLRVNGRLEVSSAANVSISHSSLIVGDTLYWNGTIQQRSVDSLILADKVTIGPGAALDISFMQDQDLERICKSLGYTTVAVYREHQGGNLTTSQIVHACDNLGESYSFDALTADQVVSLFIYVPPVNTTGPNIGAIVGGVVGGCLVFFAIVGGFIWYSMRDDPYKTIEENKKGKSDYLITTTDFEGSL